MFSLELRLYFVSLDHPHFSIIQVMLALQNYTHHSLNSHRRDSPSPNPSVVDCAYIRAVKLRYFKRSLIHLPFTPAFLESFKTMKSLRCRDTLLLLR